MATHSPTPSWLTGAPVLAHALTDLFVILFPSLSVVRLTSRWRLGGSPWVGGAAGAGAGRARGLGAAGGESDRRPRRRWGQLRRLRLYL